MKLALRRLTKISVLSSTLDIPQSLYNETGCLRDRNLPPTISQVMSAPTSVWAATSRLKEWHRRRIGRGDQCRLRTADRHPFPNHQYFENQRQQGLQKQGIEPNPVIHLFDSQGARTLENNPVIFYRVIFRGFHIKIYVHRSGGDVAPSNCIRNHRVHDLIHLDWL